MSKKSVDRLKKLKAAAKRRAKRTEQSPVLPLKIKASGSVARRMMNQHTDVLQNIEFALVRTWRDRDDVDDHIVEIALREGITGCQSRDPAVVACGELLQGVRNQREDVDDELWINGLQTVYSSLKRHSKCTSGDTRYLSFVSRYVA